jgi:hypothetical protein
VGDGDDDQGDEERDPVASSTSDATVRDAGERAACRRSAPSFRADEVRWETFLHTLKAGPAGGPNQVGQTKRGPVPISLGWNDQPQTRGWPKHLPFEAHANILRTWSEATLDARSRTGCVNEKLSRGHIYLNGRGRIILHRYGKGMAACH